MGYLFAVLAMLSFGLLGVLSKISDRYQCPPLATTLCLFGGSTVISGLSVGFSESGSLAAPRFVVGIAIAFGIVTVVSSWLFLYALKFGKITTSWVILNLSAAVPAVGSIVIYGEPLSIRKIFLLLLVVASILLLWKDMVEERSKSTQSEATHRAPIATEAP